MNKLILFGLLALLFNSINGDIACTSWKDHFSSDNLADNEEICSSLTPGNNATHCCYKEENDEIVGCVELTDDEYENIGRYIKHLEDITGNDTDIDCSSKFLSLSLFAVAALLF